MQRRYAPSTALPGRPDDASRRSLPGWAVRPGMCWYDDSWLRRLRVISTRMYDVDDLDRVRDDTIDQKIIGMHDSFARTVSPARPIHERMIGKTIGACRDRCRKALGCVPISIGDVSENRGGILDRFRAPYQLQRSPPDRSVDSKTDLIAATASSCAIDGRGSANDLATFSRNQRS